MKISDFILRYPTDLRRDGVCRVRLFHHGGKLSLVLTEMKDNTSASPYTALERVLGRLWQRGYLVAEADIIFHDEAFRRGMSFEWLGTVARQQLPPREMGKKAVLEMLGCTAEEFLPTGQDHRLAAEAMRVRQMADPFHGAPLPVEPAEAKRKLDIWRSAQPKSALLRLIEAGAGERELQAFLKGDLSFLGEYLQVLPGEYIALAELAVGEGRVDFAVFSGRSRMDVTLIEVKGADFPLATQSGYRKLSSRAETARCQLVERQRYIYQNYEAFRRQMHALRREIEAGQPLPNTLLGHKGGLRVDPEKDIDLHYLMICGRTVDDLAESRLRHAHERAAQDIKIETWDSFARKVERD